MDRSAEVADRQVNVLSPAQIHSIGQAVSTPLVSFPTCVPQATPARRWPHSWPDALVRFPWREASKAGVALTLGGVILHA